MRLRSAALLPAALLALALTACTAQADGAAPAPTAAASGAATSSAAATPTQSAAATPTQAPAAATLVVVGVDGIAVGAQSAAYSDAAAVVALMTSVTGVSPTESVIDDPWGNGTEFGRRYDFGAAWVTDIGGSAGLAVVQQNEAVRFETAAGLTLGVSRAEAEAAGAWEEYAGDSMNGPVLAIDARDAPGTSSLSRPGGVGREYVMLILDGGVVSQIQAPGNDFSDI
ncbi:hypothetical protein ACIQLJ_07400 [Microbacterium sp. NPDC091313]